MRDPYGQKMSKTKGNVVDPLETIDEFGADALRFALVHGTAPGNDLKLGRPRLENARNFANKLWNAARFVLGRPTGDDRRRRGTPRAGRSPPRARRSAGCCRGPPPRSADVDAAMTDYAFGEAARILYDAIWNEFCDWGIELAKVRLTDAGAAGGRSRGDLVGARRVAGHVPAAAAPADAVRDGGDLGRAAASRFGPAAADPGALAGARRARDAAVEADVEAMLDLVRGIRNARADAKIDPATWLPVDVLCAAATGRDVLGASSRPIERLARARPLRRHLTPEALRIAVESRADSR